MKQNVENALIIALNVNFCLIKILLIVSIVIQIFTCFSWKLKISDVTNVLGPCTTNAKMMAPELL